jgi:ribosomal protein S26
VRKLSLDERMTIYRRVRMLGQKETGKGAADSKMVLCHNCGRRVPWVGSMVYSRYHLCNDCALSFEIAAAEGRVRDVEDFVLTD